MEKMYHIGFDDSHGAGYAILPGDPGRVGQIASYFENPAFYAQNREYTTWLGKVAGKNVLAVSTGIGGPSTAIALEELRRTGVHTCIRVGTCGGIQPEVSGGDLVIASGSVRAEGTTREYVPIEYPAVATHEVTSALLAAAKKLGAAAHLGVVHCKDSFYGQHDPSRMPVGYELKDKWDAWVKAGCLASEMESAALFIVSGTLRMRAGCVLSVVWNHERERLGLTNPHVHDTDLAVRTAVEAVRILIEKQDLI